MGTADSKKVLAEYWGYDGFLPLQEEAIECIGRGRDVVVVLPTGGGKSLCYQVPAVLRRGLTVVVSPLIALMKDQVDALLECGVAAARLDSSLPPDEQDHVLSQVRAGSLRLLYLAPERLVSDRILNLLRKVDLSFVAVDEAHCVSMWGHDFRPEYRQLRVLKKAFPNIPVGAYTATATQKVRSDIAEQLHLSDPQVIVGSFDRPNLVYKVRSRSDRVRQVCEALDRHPGESGIVYCIRRKDVDSLCEELAAKGYKVAPYHAGMTGEERKKNQNDFITDRIEVIVATIAFGMGIDKSNVRYVVHTGLPKSIEHYQQESGRAGRDGLEAECCLFYAAGDYGVWKSLMRDMEPRAYDIALAKLNEMYRYCTGAVCRHQAIVRYFGQELDQPDCGACDMCLGELDCMEDSLVTAQKILSCVVRLEERFGASYVASVLAGSRDQRILHNGHQTLSTYGLLSDFRQRTVHDWIEQLAGQGYVRKIGEYNVVEVTQRGWEMLRGEGQPKLLRPAQKPAKVSKAAAASWLGVDDGLFESLRALRREIAQSKGVPAFVVFGDRTLRKLARHRPSTRDGLLAISGIGHKKCRQYGQTLLVAIRDYCQTNSLDMDL